MGDVDEIALDLLAAGDRLYRVRVEAHFAHSRVDFKSWKTLKKTEKSE
jgi:hypothetical protein